MASPTGSLKGYYILFIFSVWCFYTSSASTLPSNLNHGGDLYNRRYAKNEVKISPHTVSKLKLKWEFVAGKDITATPAVFNGTPGDKSWTAIVDERGSAAELQVNWYRDIKYHNRRFYAVDNSGRVLVCDTGLSSRGIIQIPSVTAFQKRFCPVHLVESLGELFFVHPNNYPPLRHRKIQVYKLDQSSNEIVEVKNLGDMALFIGRYNSLSLLARNYPGLKQNCIYFMDRHREY